MRLNTVLGLLVSVLLAAGAVIGVRGYLQDQQAALLAQGGVKASTIVVASQPLRFGRLVEASGLKEVEWPSGNLPEGAFHTIKDVLGETGDPRYVMAAIEKNEPVLSNKITGPGQRATLSATLGEGMKAVSIRVNDVLGVAGFVLPGDRVDVMLTRNGRNDDAFTDVLLQGVKVLAIDQSADERSDKPSVVKTVTFEVSTEEAQKLTLAQTVGSVSLALRNVASASVEQVAPIGIADLGGGTTARELSQQQNDQRFDNIEKLVRQVGDTVDKRVDWLKTEIDKGKQPPAPVYAPMPVVAPKPPVEAYLGIGVYRGTEREEYKVKSSN